MNFTQTLKDPYKSEPHKELKVGMYRDVAASKHILQNVDIYQPCQKSKCEGYGNNSNYLIAE